MTENSGHLLGTERLRWILSFSSAYDSEIIHCRVLFFVFPNQEHQIHLPLVLSFLDWLSLTFSLYLQEAKSHKRSNVCCKAVEGEGWFHFIKYTSSSQLKTFQDLLQVSLYHSSMSDVQELDIPRHLSRELFFPTKAIIFWIETQLQIPENSSETESCSNHLNVHSHRHHGPDLMASLWILCYFLHNIYPSLRRKPGFHQRKRNAIRFLCFLCHSPGSSSEFSSQKSSLLPLNSQTTHIPGL